MGRIYSRRVWDRARHRWTRERGLTVEWRDADGHRRRRPAPLDRRAADATLTVVECQALERQLARAERDAGSRQGADTATKVRMDSEDECRRMERWPTGTR